VGLWLTRRGVRVGFFFKDSPSSWGYKNTPSNTSTHGRTGTGTHRVRDLSKGPQAERLPRSRLADVLGEGAWSRAHVRGDRRRRRNPRSPRSEEGGTSSEGDATVSPAA